MTTKAVVSPRDQLVQDLKAVVDDAEELLRATAGAAGERVSERVSAARARAEETLRAARTKLDQEVVGRAKDAAKATDDYVHENPWQAVGIAAVTGLLVGVLISRR